MRNWEKEIEKKSKKYIKHETKAKQKNKKRMRTK